MWNFVEFARAFCIGRVSTWEDTKYIANIYGMEKMQQYDELKGSYKILDLPEAAYKEAQ